MILHVMDSLSAGTNKFDMILACDMYGMVGYKSDMELV